MAQLNKSAKDYLKVNRSMWNSKVDHHYGSNFYDVEAFIEGKSSLNSIELNLLGDVSDQSVLHLQCHFGMDSISLSRMGAKVVALDFSEEAIAKANALNDQLNTSVRFVCADVYSTAEHIEQEFDRVFTSYGTIGWLPDLDRWAQVIAQRLRTGGQLVFVEFHPVLWMMDRDIEKIEYSYFKSDPIEEVEEGTYAEQDLDQTFRSITWNHSLSEVITALAGVGLQLDHFSEYDYSPYPIFAESEEIQPGRYVPKGKSGLLPLVYALVATKV